MEYGKLGKTDIEVSKLCVGCMSFGKAGTMHDWTNLKVRKLLNMRLIWDITFLTRQMDILPEQVRNIWEER